MKHYSTLLIIVVISSALAVQNNDLPVWMEELAGNEPQKSSELPENVKWHSCSGPHASGEIKSFKLTPDPLHKGDIAHIEVDFVNRKIIAQGSEAHVIVRYAGFRIIDRHVDMCHRPRGKIIFCVQTLS
eukprot:TRINITY_DN45333_c0_g1_i1.p1 TRINITY_DN45333_c0_g1~~TRINITY_DN45333_c0_g1_i1.p1  ORF type:complete len:129 (+),score=23.19 TRINITY_DN45333_c0_g1_i1:104-490(+)